MSGTGTTIWTAGGVAAILLAVLWGKGIVRKRRAMLAAEAEAEAAADPPGDEPTE